MSVTIVKKFGIFFLGMKHALKQVRPQLLTHLQKFGNAKFWVMQKLSKVSFPPFYFAYTQAPIDLCDNPSKCKAPGLLTLDHLTCCLTIFILLTLQITLLPSSLWDLMYINKTNLRLHTWCM
jgi:hypothetical protein